MKAKKIESTDKVKDSTFSQTEDNDLSCLAKIIILLRELTGHDFSFYKKSVLLGRIERRISIFQIGNIHNYVRFLQENPNEVGMLFKDLLIGVTSFFRDAAMWETLKENVMPALINESPDGYVVRTWVPGCSTGEESYSLAIVFAEALGSLPIPKKLTLKIFATDLNEEAIKIARHGRYSKNIAAHVSPDRLNRYFTLEGEGYRVNMDIHNMVTFACHDVIKDAPFTRLDLLSCRNLLIYMEPVLQQKLIKQFNKSLHPGGIMVLGSAESLGSKSDLFNEVDAKWNVFKSNANFASPKRIEPQVSLYRQKSMLTENIKPFHGFENIKSLTDQILLKTYAPASVLAKSNGDILYVTGHTRKYLDPIEGEANWNILMIAREGLCRALLPAFSKALLSFDAVILPNIKIRMNGGTQQINITVQHIEEPESLKGLVMVVFNDVSPIIADDIENHKSKKLRSIERIEELENQLQRGVEELQSIREEMHTSQEKLKSTNEELQTINEKQLKNNEKLNIAREKTQILNEELLKINIELQSKVRDDIKANDDMKNLLNNTGITTLFLDKELNIRRYSDQVTKIFKLRYSDLGRPFTDLVSDLQYPEIDEHARQVLSTLIPLETAVATHDGRWFAVRIMPYRTLDDCIEGLVITFTNITAAKKIEIELKAANEEHHRSKSSKYDLIHLDPERSKTIQN